MEITARQWLYPANLLSLARLVLAAPVTWLVARPEAGQDGLLIGLIAFGILTDAMDGYLSRRLNQVSDLGKILDPVADKVVLVAGILAAVLCRGFPALIVLLLGYRDLLIVCLGAVVTRRLKRITTANTWGKLNTVLVAALCLCYAIEPGMWATRALTYASLVSIVISGVVYYRIGERHLFPEGGTRWGFRLLFFLLPAGAAWLLSEWAPGLRWL